MRLRILAVAATMLVAGLGAVATPASADHDDRYYGQRYYRGHDREEIRRREILRSRMLDLADRVRLAERERALDRRDASDLYQTLDRVRDFLRNDRYLSDSEFDRRMGDLDNVQRRFRDRTRGRFGRYNGRYDSRYDSRYDGRYGDRYWRGDRDYYNRIPSDPGWRTDRDYYYYRR